MRQIATGVLAASNGALDLSGIRPLAVRCAERRVARVPKGNALRAAISRPFAAAWAFEVELLGRLMGRWGEGPRIDDDALLEIPIRAWRDVDGSKVRLTGMIRALLDLARMGLLSRRLGERHTAAIACVAPRRRLRTSARDSWLPAMLPSLALPAAPSFATESLPPSDTESGVRLIPGAEEPVPPQKAGGKRVG